MDPLGDRYLARGAVLRRREADGRARYWVRWGEEVVCELVCSSGRYDLELFAGREIGVQGAVIRQATVAPDADAAQPARIDVSRIEVISHR